jgi:hypothetical protein
VWPWPFVIHYRGIRLEGLGIKLGVTRKEHSIFVLKYLGRSSFGFPITQLADNYNFVRK